MLEHGNGVASSLTLEKALRLLEQFSPERPKWGIRELARETNINPTTIYRLVRTFLNAGFLEQDPETQQYSLGPKFVKLAALYNQQHPLPDVAHAVFQRYANRFEHNFYLGTLSGYEVIYLAVLDGRGTIKVAVEVGGTTELHSTAIGKALLAFQSDDFIESFLASHAPKARTPRSIVNREQLWEQVLEVRQRGFAFNDGEEFEDVAAVGVPLMNYRQEPIAAVSLAFPRHLLLDGRIQLDEVLILVREVANEIVERSDAYYRPRFH